jgi:hypothetical protein
VQEDDHGVGRLPRRAYGLEQAWLVLGGRQPTLRGGRRPRLDELGVQHLRRADDRDLVAVDRGPIRPVRFGGVLPDPDYRELGLLDGGQRVPQTALHVVHAVVVGHRGHVDPGRLERAERGGRRPERELFARRPRAPGRDRGLQVDDGQVGLAQQGRDRPEGGTRITVQPPPQHPFEVHVPAKRDRVRLSLRLLGAGRPGRTGRGRSGARLALGRRAGRGSDQDKSGHNHCSALHGQSMPLIPLWEILRHKSWMIPLLE